jgi:predicted nucleic acid-binding protein
MNNSSIVCVDASLVVRRVTSQSDPFHAQWERWEQENTRLVAPSLLYYEVTNGLYRYEKSGILPLEAVNKALSAALALPIQLIGDAELHRQAKFLAKKYTLPASYHAHYLALAERLGINLYTVDAHLFTTLQPFHLDWIKLAQKHEPRPPPQKT